MNTGIVFVCTGNTCRSPMAEAIFNSVAGKAIAHSAGIAVSFPKNAAENAKIAVRKYGGNLDEHVAQQLTVETLQEASLVLTMTRSQKEMLSQYVNGEKLMTLAEFAGEDADVTDPYGGDLDIYTEIADKIYEYIRKGLSKQCECRSAADDDAEQIVQMEKENFPDAWSEKAIEAEIQRQRVMVLKANEQICGYCIFMTAADEGEILRIATSKHMRKLGMGKKLLVSVIGKMKEYGCNSAFLEVRSSNTAAISLYKSIGFEEIGVRKSYYRDNGEDAKLFKLEIKER